MSMRSLSIGMLPEVCRVEHVNEESMDRDAARSLLPEVCCQKSLDRDAARSLSS